MRKFINNNGFTLIEVLVAMVILTVGLLGTAALITGIIRGNKVSNRITTATTCAQDKMEEIRRLGYSGIPTSDTTTTEPYDSITNYSLYKRVTFTDVVNPAAGMKTVTVTVYWDSDNSSIELKTILAQ
ncbi:MAG: prepilin-type N-terminal cleavage/methylation domain-containing protein [Proteobacteria bacterium]|nr:prepilin-type N-terminal cleavage/methylation domain-containing protein [Pseudomonadota bacterium]MBU4287937.1 prepilin-type N-terminal cleavage/methylation domain-containing protein [Pseudomonadota bacterium]MCG2756922.1 prepilin-type N-terminal cleavage/methylation domain-containing protein [Desulfobacteraceae bacterium]